MHMVGTPDGSICSRDVREVPPQENDVNLYKSMKWTPWHPRKNVDVLDPKVIVPSKEQQIVDKSIMEPCKAVYDDYNREMGKTLWCRGCKFSSPDIAYSKRCLKNRQLWETSKRRKC